MPKLAKMEPWPNSLYLACRHESGHICCAMHLGCQPLKDVWYVSIDTPDRWGSTMFKGSFLSMLAKSERLQLTLAGHITQADWDINAAYSELLRGKNHSGTDYSLALDDLPAHINTSTAIRNALNCTSQLLWSHRRFVKDFADMLYKKGRLSGSRIDLFIWEHYHDEFKQSTTKLNARSSIG